MYHSFDTDVAIKYGVDQAVLIANFQFWISHNAANKRNFYDDRFWTYNSYKAFTILFPYYTEKQIRRIIGDLVDKGVLLVGNYNAKEYDNTKWYTFTDPVFWLSNIPPAHYGKGGIAQTGRGGAETGTMPAQMGQPIPNTFTPVNNSDPFVTPLLKSNGVTTPPNLSENGPEDKRKKAKKKKAPAEKKESSLYTQMVKVYFDWHNDYIGVDPIMTGGNGTAMVNLVAYISQQAKKKLAANGMEVVAEDDINMMAIDTWKMLLDALRFSEKIDPFLRNQIKLQQIFSNLTNVIKQLKNGNGKGIATNKSAGVDEIERELQLARNMANP